MVIRDRQGPIKNSSIKQIYIVVELFKLCNNFLTNGCKIHA